MTPQPAPADVVALVLATSAAAVPGLRRWFTNHGFVAGPASGPTFAVEAAQDRFAELFGVRPQPADDGGWTTAAGDELPLGQLPDAVRPDVTAVAFERGPELTGPGGGDEP